MDVSEAAPIRSAYRADRTRLAVLAIGVLIALRFLAGGLLPLYFGDEPYYWLWSRHLDWGYFDHPPAIAFLIRAGTALFGKTEFGVRVAGLVLSIPASFCVWRTGTLLLGSTQDGARAALFFNLTLMVTVNTMLATPDAPALACSAAFTWAMAELAATGRAPWWIAAGLFAGLGLLSKYTTLFLGAGAFLWLVCAKEARPWLRTPWPWMGGALALLVFLPNLLWNAEHGWPTFVFQFGRVGRSHHGWWFLPEFLGEQFLLASPIVFLLAARGLGRATVSPDRKRFLVACLIWPAVLYFTVHALHDRVHRNWIDVVYPALAVAAADIFRQRNLSTIARAAAAPVALLFLAVVYLEALFRVVPLDKVDPLRQHFASGMQDVVAPIARDLALTGAHRILTTDFPTTAWLKFYLPAGIPVIQINEEYRYPYAPRATGEDLAGTLLYVSLKFDGLDLLQRNFAEVEPVAKVLGQGEDVPVTPFQVFSLQGFHGEPFGRKL